MPIELYPAIIVIIYIVAAIGYCLYSDNIFITDNPLALKLSNILDRFTFPIYYLLKDSKYRLLRYIGKITKYLLPTFVLIMVTSFIINIILLIIFGIYLILDKTFMVLKKHYLAT